MRMQANCQHAGVLGALRLELAEGEFQPPRHLAGGVALDRVDDAVVDLDIIGHRHEAAGLDRHVRREVIHHPVADIIDAGFHQQIGCIHGLAQARREPAAHFLAGEALDLLQAGADQRQFATLDMVDRLLVHAVAMNSQPASRMATAASG